MRTVSGLKQGGEMPGSPSLAAEIPQSLGMQPHRSELPNSDCPCNFKGISSGRVHSNRIERMLTSASFGGAFFNLIFARSGYEDMIGNNLQNLYFFQIILNWEALDIFGGWWLQCSSSSLIAGLGNSQAKEAISFILSASAPLNWRVVP